MTVKTYIRSQIRSLAHQRRDPRYIFVLIFSLLIFAICFLQVQSAGLFDSVEKPVFRYFNDLSPALHDFWFAVTQLGGLGGLLVWVPLAWYLINRRAALTVLATGVVGWTLAKVAKAISARGRPGEFIADIHLFDGETFGGYGFPSGHSTFVAACAAVLYFQVAPKYRKYLLLAVLLVGISRMYLGAHFPLDIVGGWALGAVVGSVFALVLGMSSKGLSAVRLKNFLNQKGMEIRSLAFANVDARGSRPVYIVTNDGKEYFGKLFGKQEHAADWLYKIFRFFRYKNLQAEEPHFSSRRNIEIEAFAMMWAKQAGVRVANVVDMYRYGSNWLLVQEKLVAKPLHEYNRVRQTALVDAWKQVAKLHAANIAHRDLRATNIMIDTKGQAWVIDFGFAEVAATPARMHMDTAELLMSMALVVGVERTVAAATSGIGKKAIKQSLPYLQTAVFSGATLKMLKKDKAVLGDLKNTIMRDLNIAEEVTEVNVVRINRRKVINIVLLAVFVYVIAPQLGAFKDAFGDARIAEPWWFVLLAIASLLTYVTTGAIYVVLSNVPLKLREASLVQLAASFMSKVLPGGVGNTALNVKYLTRAGLDALETSAVITIQAVVGFVMFMVPFGLFLVLNGMNVFRLVHLDVNPSAVIKVLVVILIGIGVGASIPKVRAWAIGQLSGGLEKLRNISTPPRELAVSAVASLAVSALYIICLYAALQSVGVAIGVSVVTLVYASAVIAKSAIPVPGGLGPVEAAMIATLVTFGVSKGEAISAVLLYRLGTFWIPIPFSLLAYRIITRRKIV